MDMTKLKPVLESLTLIIIGFVTGSFIGGLPLGYGLTGALIGGVTGAVILTVLVQLMKFKQWHTAADIIMYVTIGLLPGLLIGGSAIIGLGVTGAILFGIVSSIIYSTVIYKWIKTSEQKARYIRYPGHYTVLFLLGSLSVFIAILVIDFLGNVLNFEELILKIPLFPTITGIVGLAFPFYIIRLFFQKRKHEAWSEAFRANRRLLIGLLSLAILISATLFSVHAGWIPLNTLIYTVAGIFIPYGIGLILPLSFGFLLAFNENRPVMGAVFALVGSIFVILIGISVAPMLLLPGSGLMWAGLITGLFMLMFSLSALFKPETHFFSGCSIIVLSILSFLGAAGGLIIGGILGIVGGTFIAAWAGRDTVSKDDDASVTNHDVQIESNTVSG